MIAKAEKVSSEKPAILAMGIGLWLILKLKFSFSKASRRID
jgi:hypothetical protein